MNQDEPEVIVGRIGGPYGVKGWVRVSSYTSPQNNILQYAPWILRDAKSGLVVRVAELLEGRAQGKSFVARLDGIVDRDAAEALKGAGISIRRNQLPELNDGSYYWADLEGLAVLTADGDELGQIDHMVEAGAADVMVVSRPGGDRYLVPFIRDETVIEVDLEARIVRVDWDTDE